MIDTSQIPIDRVIELPNKLESITSNAFNTQSQLNELSNNFNRNYGMVKLPINSVLSSSRTSIVSSITITTKGRPVFLMSSGDNNPTNSSWCQISLLREDTLLTYMIDCSVTNSCNIPFAISYLDMVPAGTYTYNCEYKLGSGTINLSEDNNTAQTPQFIAFEI